MKIDSPSNPSVGDSFTFNNITYRWDGTKWTSSITPAVGIPTDNSQLTNGAGYITNVVSGVLTATSFSGDGSNLTGISAGIGPNDSVNTTGIITASSFYGDGSNLTGISTFSGDYNDLTNTPTIPTNNNELTNGAGYVTSSGTVALAEGLTGTPNITVGVATATRFVGDGSGLTGITASGSGVIVQDDGSTIGTAGTINFATNLSVSPISAGVVTVTAAAGSGSTANVSADTLVVSGVSTLGIVTGVTSVEATDFYGKVHGNGGDITGINANNITSGTLPNNRFPDTLPAVDGSQLADGQWTLGADGTNNYTFTGIGFTQTTNDPDFYLQRGNVYEFVNNMDAHPFQIQDTQNGTVGNPYNNGVTNNGAQNGTVRIEVPFNAPNTLYYQCTSHPGMGGTIFISPLLR